MFYSDAGRWERRLAVLRRPDATDGDRDHGRTRHRIIATLIASFGPRHGASLALSKIYRRNTHKSRRRSTLSWSRTSTVMRLLPGCSGTGARNSRVLASS